MNKKISKIILIIGLSLITLLSFNSSKVYADTDNPKTGATTTETQDSTKEKKKGGCAGANTSIIKCDDNEDGIGYLLSLVAKILSGIIGVLAVVMIVVAGAKYASAGDSPEKVKEAKTMITNVVIGVVIYVFLVAIVDYLVPGGLFK